MNRQILESMRRSCLWMAVFAVFFVFMYLVLVLLSRFVYVYFRGFSPGIDKNLLRAVFYGISAASIACMLVFKRVRYSKKGLKPFLNEPYRLAKRLLLTVVVCMAVAEIPLVCGFFLFFLGALYLDFFILSGVSVALIFLNVPSVEFWAQKIKEAL